MAIKINTALTTNSGINLASGSLVTSDIIFPMTFPVDNGAGGVKPYRIINYNLYVYATQQSYLDGDSAIGDGVKEFGVNWSKVMTEAEYIDILANGTLAEVWLKDYLESILGVGTCSIIDPFA